MRLMNTLAAVAFGTALAVAAQQSSETPKQSVAKDPAKKSQASKSSQPAGSPGAKSATEKKMTAQSGIDPKEDPSTKWLTTGNPQVDAMDKTADPCEDFYQYACGNWRKANPLPADKSRYGRFTELLDHNQLVLKDILEKASNGGASRSATDQKIGDYYASCMDEAKINELGAKPIEAYLKQIDSLQSKEGLTDLIIGLHGKTLPGFFRFGARPDFDNAAMEIGDFDQGGLTMPVDYYLDESPRMKGFRDKYLVHVANMLKLSGWPEDKAKTGAQTVLNMETDLAKNSLKPIERRNPQIQKNPMTTEQLQQRAPSIQWNRYLEGIGAPTNTKLNVSVPKFMDAMSKLVETSPLDDIKTYLRWQLLNNTANTLAKPFEDEHFDFFSRTLTGQQVQQPRWKRCATRVDNNLGEALGIAYVDRTFGSEGKAITVELVKGIEDAMRRDIHALDWMGEDTKKMALTKLEAVANKIGYPEKWRDYSSVDVKEGDFFGNDERASIFELKRDLKKIGQPTDKKEWGMTPPTVNAYYNPLENNINFPAGILQPPFFNKGKDDALNYGAIGVVVGHELTHGFDDQGSQFDAQGNLKDWWTAIDRKKFDELEGCFVDEYSGFTTVEAKDGNPPVNLNGKLTLGENTADNGGMRLAWMALMEKYKQSGKKPGLIDGMTPEQRFFLGFAQVWCENVTEAELVRRAKSDPHSTGKYRTIGAIRNMPEFQQAYKCKTGTVMAPEKRCKSW
jgi:endothelin-converting enzyme/putative endopeptidase